MKVLKLAVAAVIALLFFGSDGLPGARSAGADHEVPNDFTYQLQKMDLSATGDTRFDLVVMDYSKYGDDASRYSEAQISALKDSPGGHKTVLSYMSVGEAEDYRWYWERSWDQNRDGKPDAAAPDWLGHSNPDWPGNYKVRYWDPEWQTIVDSYLDRVIEAGYDGVYLDVIDAYWYWRRANPDSEMQMVEFVKHISAYARSRNPDFQIYVQNAEELSIHPDYLATVSGIGREDLFYDGNRLQPRSETNYAIRQLDRFEAAGKPVLVTDYVTKRDRIDAFYRKAEAHGYVPYATRRNLDVLTINRGHLPD